MRFPIAPARHPFPKWFSAYQKVPIAEKLRERLVRHYTACDWLDLLFTAFLHFTGSIYKELYEIMYMNIILFTLT